MCKGIVDALAKIEKEAPYKDRFEFEVIPMGSPEGKAGAEKYDWQGHGHGLVILRDGKLLKLIPGHSYGRDEIIAALDEVSAR